MPTPYLRIQVPGLPERYTGLEEVQEAKRYLPKTVPINTGMDILRYQLYKITFMLRLSGLENDEIVKLEQHRLSNTTWDNLFSGIYINSKIILTRIEPSNLVRVGNKQFFEFTTLIYETVGDFIDDV